MSGLFEHLAATDDSERVSARQAVAVANKRVQDFLGDFVKLASDDEERASRLALVEDDVARIVSETVSEYGGDPDHTLAAVRVVLGCDESESEEGEEDEGEFEPADAESSKRDNPAKRDKFKENQFKKKKSSGPWDAPDAETAGQYPDHMLPDHTDDGPTDTFKCGHCGAPMERYSGEGDISCPGCGSLHNSFGQRLAPRSQWGEETGESLSDISNPHDPESLGYPYESKTANPESINLEPNWENMRAWLLNVAKTDPEKAQEIAGAMGSEAPPELVGPGGPGGQEMGNPYPHDEPSPGFELGGEAGPYQASVRVARRPKMCPYHSELVDASLQSGSPQYAAFSTLVGSPSHCKGGFDGSCNFKPSMVTQEYWDNKQDEYAERRQQREMERAQPTEITPIPEPTEPVAAEEGEGITDLNTELSEAPSAVGDGISEHFDTEPQMAMAAHRKEAIGLPTPGLPSLPSVPNPTDLVNPLTSPLSPATPINQMIHGQPPVPGIPGIPGSPSTAGPVSDAVGTLGDAAKDVGGAMLGGDKAELNGVNDLLGGGGGASAAPSPDGGASQGDGSGWHGAQPGSSPGAAPGNMDPQQIQQQNMQNIQQRQQQAPNFDPSQRNLDYYHGQPVPGGGPPKSQFSNIQREAEAPRDGGGAVKHEELSPNLNKDGLKGPSPKIDKGEWKPNALNSDGNLAPIDSEQSNSPHSTESQDVGDKPDWEPQNQETWPPSNTNAVTESQSLPTADGNSLTGDSSERNVEQPHTNTFNDNGTDPVTSDVGEAVLSSAQDPDRNPIRSILESGFPTENEVKTAIARYNTERK